MRFRSLLDKIRNAPELKDPFTHLHLDDFFDERDFRDIVSAPEVNLEPQPSDERLFQALFERGYEIIGFPGCIGDERVYLEWHKEKRRQVSHNNTACEGFGVALRLTKPRSPVIAELLQFLGSPEFQKTLAEKFAIDQARVYYDAGLQKYLDGYEISPHPDVRKKALTFMVNLNPHGRSETLEYHTHYMRFREAYRYVQAYWEGNPGKERCWVPWEWCETSKVQTRNNSIVAFSPRNDTIHAVKARYDHLTTQRTQLYGNLWYHQSVTDGYPAWEEFVIESKKNCPPQ